MARGTTFAALLTMLKAECGYNTQTGVATAQDTELKALLNNRQQWLWSQYQWPFLYTHKDVGLGGGVRYYNYPPGISLDYPTEVETKWGNLWYPVDYGIKGEQYEAVDPDMGEVQDPASRWQTYSPTQFEIWPVPAGQQTLRFWGTGLATTMVVDSDPAVLDDLLIVLYAAAEKLARGKQADAQAKLQLGQALFRQLKCANLPNTVMTIGGGPESRRPRREQRIVTVVGNPNH